MTKGKLTVCSLQEWGKYKSDINYLIVRSWKGKEIPDLPQFTELAPSVELFSWTLKQKSKGVPDDVWFKTYSKRYEQESYSAIFRRALDFILDLLDKGYSITLCCYCTTEFCHRFILADIIEKLDYEVVKK